VAAAVFGKITDPRNLGEYPRVVEPEHYMVNDDNFAFPPEDSQGVEIIMGPNIKPFPKFEPLDETLEGVVLIKVGDNITTDHIMPAGNKVLPLRSNIPAMSEFVFNNVDEDFAKRAREQQEAGFVIGGENYGQGSSREHAAIVPRFLGVCAKIAKSFARIHKANLINFGILPLTFANADDYNEVDQDDRLRLEGIKTTLQNGGNEFVAEVGRSGKKIRLKIDISDRDRKILLAGGLINMAREK
jgi:aconitate hydratase